MTIYHSGLLLASAVASDTGMQALARRITKIAAGRRGQDMPRRGPKTPLGPRKRSNLLKGILRDDWAE